MKNILILWKLIIIIIFLFELFYFFLIKIIKEKGQIFLNPNNKYSLDNVLNNIKCKTDIFFNFTNLSYIFSYKYNIEELQYNISFSDKNDDLIKSSDLILFHKVHINCILTLFDNHRKIQFESFPNIINNTKYKCMDYIKINQKFKFGIKYYIENCESKIIYFFNNNLLKHEILYLFNDKFNSLLIDKNYNNLIVLINKTNSEERNSLNLKKMFIRKPIYSSKSDISLLKNKWYFKNIYNNYFCFCRGNCHYKNIDNQCKYLFYLYIIDENKYLYNKTDYLFSDFYLISKSSDDTYPLFEEMVKQNLSVHYMDEKKEIYDKYCFNNKYCLKIIPVVNGNIDIDGDFLEKYLDIILRLKTVIAGESFYSPEKIFYNIDYITLIILN